MTFWHAVGEVRGSLTKSFYDAALGRLDDDEPELAQCLTLP